MTSLSASPEPELGLAEPAVVAVEVEEEADVLGAE